MEWVLLVLVALLIIAAIVYFGRDVRDSGGNSGEGPAPVEVVIDLTTPAA